MHDKNPKTRYNLHRQNKHKLICKKQINEVLEKAKQKPLKPLTRIHKETRMKYLAKLIKAGNDEPGTAVTFDPQTLEPIDHGKKRVGRPKLNWYQVTVQDFWQKAKLETPETKYASELKIKNPVHIHALKAYADTYK